MTQTTGTPPIAAEAASPNPWRRVVSGVDGQGRSRIETDGACAATLATPAFAISQIWQVGALPVSPLLADDSSGGQVSISPPAGGFVYLVTTFPPDSTWDMRAGYADALARSGDAAAARQDSQIAGLHQTETLDIITVLSGEIFAVMETGETCLKAGDSFVQRGTKHAWSNRSASPCTIVAVMAGGKG